MNCCTRCFQTTKKVDLDEAIEKMEVLPAKVRRDTIFVTNVPDDDVEKNEKKGNSRTPTLWFSSSNSAGKFNKAEDVVLISHEISLFAVFDSHRSIAAAEYCEQNFTKMLMKNLKKVKVKIQSRTTYITMQSHSQAREVLRQTFLDVHEAGRTKIKRSGCTAVVLWFYKLDEPKKSSKSKEVAKSSVAENDSMKQEDAEEIFFIVANAGDGRCLGGLNTSADEVEALRFTVDHKASVAEEVMRVKQAGGNVTGNLLEGMLQITRGIGDYDFEPGFIAEPYITDPMSFSDASMKSAYKFFVLSSDGIFDVLKDEEVVETVNKAMSEQGLKKASQELLKHAKELKVFDDVSCIIVASSIS